MSKKFHALNRNTDERWLPHKTEFRDEKEEYLVMYDSGYLAIVSGDNYNTYISPLDSKIWKVVHN